MRRQKQSSSEPGVELAAAAAAVSGDAFALIAVDAGQRFRYLDVNQAAARVTGFSREEIVGHYLDELLAPDDVVERARLWGEVARSGTPVTYQLSAILPNGRKTSETTVTRVADPSDGVTRLLVIAREVPDREAAPVEAAGFQAQVEAMLAHSFDGFVLADVEGAITFASPSCEALLGLSPTELVAQGTVADQTHPDDLARVTEHWVSALGHPRSVETLEVRMLHRDGGWRDFDVRMVNKIDDAAVGAVVVTFCDVSRHRAAEREVVRVHERFEQILAGASDAIVTVDASHVVMGFNDAAEETFGYPADEIVGHPLAMLLPERLRDVHAHHVEEFAGGDVARRLMSERAELLGRRKDGSEFPVEVTISRSQLDGDVYLTAIIRDVSKRCAVEAALRDSETRLRKLIEYSGEMVVVVGRDGEVLWTSPASERLFGYASGSRESPGLNLGELGHPDDQGLLAARFVQAQQRAGVPVEVEARGRHADGTWRWFAATITDRCDDPAVGGIVLNVVDTTSGVRRAAQEVALARLGQLSLSGSAVGDLFVETVGAIVENLDVDLAFYAQIGPGGDDLLMRASAGRVDGPSDALPIDRDTHWGQALSTTSVVTLPALGEPAAGSDALLAAGICCGITVGIAVCGQPYGVVGAYATAPREFSSHEVNFLRGAANILANAIDRRSSERALEHQMLHDSLTGLPNRMLLDDRLDQALQRERRTDGCVALLLIDLDDFKVVNESLGHPAGDALLQAVATRIGAVIRPGDTLARFGGDEFVVVVECDAQTCTATEIAERVLAAFRRPFQVTPDHELFVTASIGVAVRHEADLGSATLLSEADLAMYRAKHRGGDTYVVFDDGMRTHVQARLDLALALRHALDRDEFRLTYQPEIDLPTGRIVDVEALLRWEHPTDGLLSPDSFLETAEQTGLIIPIGEWTISQACAQAAIWQRTYGTRAPQRIFVNLSARQLLHPDLIPTVERSLRTSGIDPSHLGFEVTEHVFIDDIDAAADVLGRLHRSGHALCLDDFGTGYSSLTFLHALPFDCLKVDRSFVSGLGETQVDEHDTTGIVTAIIDMAHDLGLVVTAEGVENSTQAEILGFLRCDRAQGYHYTQPLSPEHLAHAFAHNDPAA